MSRTLEPISAPPVEAPGWRGVDTTLLSQKKDARLEEVNALPPTVVPPAPFVPGEKPLSSVAKYHAYRLGNAHFGPWVQRIIDLEELVGTLLARVDSLEQSLKNSAPSHLSKVEKRG